MTDPIIRIESISKTYTRGVETIQVLDQLSLEVQEGEFFALMGPSGSGKTTLLNLIAGLDTPDSGRIMVAQREL